MNDRVTATETLWQRRIRAPWRGTRLALLATPSLLLFCVLLLSFSLTTLGLGLLLTPAVVVAVRKLADTYRGLVAEWAGVRIERPYLSDAGAREGENVWRRFVRLTNDPATWRDALWLIADPVVVLFTAGLPTLLVLYGVWGLVLAGGMGAFLGERGWYDWYAVIPVGAGYGDDPVRIAATAVLGTAFLATGFLQGPRLLDAYGRWARSLLGPTEKSRLELRVEHLTETRAAAVDVSATELRRIERDLHDGAQARLVAMGMTLGAIEHLMDKDPAKARELVARTRESSAQALNELRDLVRGIHPPVLADRGLADAVRALALDHPLDVRVSGELPGRLAAPVESAAYFAVAELLTNAAKHAGARRVWIDLRHEDGLLRVSVTDDGHGGASPEGGTGLRGIERRIGTFDGVLALNSPVGGPTIATLELPCASSSPKTSLS